MKIFQVGGSIRDELLGQTPKDRDWVVVGSSPEEMLDNGFKPIGKDFPVFIHSESKEEYALARTEKKSGYGYKGFTFYFGKDVTLEEDLSRRDFTINAIAKNDSGELIDPFGGQEDLNRKLFKHVSQAFLEDPLRAIRIARFKTYPHLQTFNIDTSTQEMLKEIGVSGELAKLSKDRIWTEIQRSLQSPFASEFFSTLLDYQLHLPWLDNLVNPECKDSKSPEVKWAELESKNNFKLVSALPVPNQFKAYTALLKNMLSLKKESSEELLIKNIEKINFHRNMDQVNLLLELDLLKKDKYFISKLAENILNEDFAALKEVSNNEVRDVKLHLIKTAIIKTYE